MDTVEILLSALDREPGDDTTWLALADALEEHGAPRQAEATRLSLWLRRQPDDPELAKWELRLRQLLAVGVRPYLPWVRYTLPGGVPLDLALIPPGTFYMGGQGDESRDEDEDPSHRVRLTRGFYLGIYPVTQAQWNAVLAPLRLTFHGPNLPVEHVSWYDAWEFCSELCDRFGRNFRLPTEAEWEYACRAGTRSPFAFGDVLTTDQANYDGNYPYGQSPKGIYRERTSPVTLFQPNAWGLHDMHGNVWEWCNDWFWAAYYLHSVEENPAGPVEGSSRTVRGGSWYFGARPTRSSYRFWMDPEQRDDDLGFRVVLDLE
jgi:uncharacterized protein (TIGR02996 family)